MGRPGRAVLLVLALALLLAPLLVVPASRAPAAQTTTLPAFKATTSTITPALAYRMRYSYRAGCPVPLSQLRYITVSTRTWSGGASRGELVVHATQVSKVITVFRNAYARGFPIWRMQLIDNWRGDDDASMAANNTSAFNCRRVTGGTSWSMHAYGIAIDINPIQNPYVRSSYVAPPAGRAYVTRSPYRTGMINNPLLRDFLAAGWKWGGSWTYPKDYMHFSANGR